MNWFASLQESWELSRLARALPARLVHDYGWSKTYTLGQLNAALLALHVSERLRPFAFATFLDRPDYDDLAAPADRAVPFEQARQSFLKAARRAKSTYIFEPSDSASVQVQPLSGF